jgi:hypothetical protein
LFQIGILKDEEWSIPTELQRKAFDGTCRLLHQQLSDCRGSGERYLMYKRIGTEFVADLRSVFSIGRSAVLGIVGGS